MENYYKILGLEETATQEEIKGRYLFLVKAYHPDRYQDPKDKERAEEELKRINVAYKVISEKISSATNEVDQKDSGSSGKKTKGQAEKDKVGEVIEYCKQLLLRWDPKVWSLINLKTKSSYYEQLSKIYNEIAKITPSLPVNVKKEKFGELYVQVDIVSRMSIALGLEVKRNPEGLPFKAEEVLNFLALFIILRFQDYLSFVTPIERESIENNTSYKKMAYICIMLVKELYGYGFAFQGSDDTRKVSKENWSTNESDNKKYNEDSKNYCQSCGSYTYTTSSTYRKNIGLLILRRYSKIEGDLCADCNERLFWNAFLTNVFLGWWGVISCIINPFLIFSNIFEYISSWKIRKLSEFSPKSKVDYKLLSLMGILMVLFFSYIISAVNKYSLPSATVTPVKHMVSPTGKIKTPTTKSILTATKTPSPAVIFSDDFSDLTNGQLIVTNPADSSLHWTQFKDTISDGIITVTVNNQIMPSAHAGEIILWRIVDSNNFYYFWMNGLGTVSVRKFVNDKHTILYTSEKPISGATGAKVPVIISTIGNQIKIYVAGKNVTTLYDLSFDSGKIGLGALTDKENQITSSFDNLIVYSAKEFERVFPKNTPFSYLSVLQTPTPRKTVDSRVRFTVKNDYSHTQEVYCEGKLMLTLQPGEEAWFMVPKGTWRFDFCSPGSYPCNNVYSITVNGTYKWTIK